MAKGWEFGTVHVPVAIPQLGADQRLGAVQEDLLDRHPAGGHRRFTLGHQLFQQSRIGGHAGPAVDAQGLIHAGDHEQQADAATGDDVVGAVGAPVAGPVGDRQGNVVDDMDETRRVAFGRGVEIAVGAGRRHHHEGRAGDELAGVFVEPRHGLVAG